MKRNLRVIQINGFRGLILAIFVVCCLIAGFIGFPGLVTMGVWNYFADFNYSVPSISLIGGVLLWGIMVCSYLILKKRNFFISFRAPQEITNDEIQMVMEKIKAQQAKSIMSEHEAFMKSADEKISEKIDVAELQDKKEDLSEQLSEKK